MIEVPNARLLSLAARRERRGELIALAPGLLVVAILVGPALWLAGLSFVSDGVASLAHYRRMIDNPSYAAILLTTFELSAIVTLAVAVIGYPVAYAITLLPTRWAVVSLACVAIPFWTSLLVRTYAWMVILQRNGILNSWLLGLGLVDKPVRMANSLMGTSIGMVHIMLPFLIFPLYAAMRNIDGNLMRAAYGLGAGPTRAFFDVFLPLSLRGLATGMLLTFVLCLGFYVTPQLLGGGNVTTVSIKIQQNVTVYSDWGAASALAVVLSGVVGALFLAAALFGRRRKNGRESEK